MTKKKILMLLPESVAINQINEFIPFTNSSGGNNSTQDGFAIDLILQRDSTRKDFTHSENIYHGIHPISQYYSLDQLIYDSATRRGCIINNPNDKYFEYKGNPAIRLELIKNQNTTYDYVGYSTIRSQFIEKQPDYSYSFALRVDVLSNLVGKSTVVQKNSSLDYQPAILNKDAISHAIQQSGIKFYNCSIISANFTTLYNVQHFTKRKEEEKDLMVVGLPITNDSLIVSGKSLRVSRKESESELLESIKNILNDLEKHNIIESGPKKLRYKLNDKIWTPGFDSFLNEKLDGNKQRVLLAKDNIFLFIISNFISARSYYYNYYAAVYDFDNSEEYSHFLIYLNEETRIKLFDLSAEYSSQFTINHNIILAELSKYIASTTYKEEYNDFNSIINDQNIKNIYKNLKDNIGFNSLNAYSKSSLENLCNMKIILSESFLDVITQHTSLFSSNNCRKIFTKLANHFILDDIKFSSNHIHYVDEELTLYLAYNNGFIIDISEPNKPAIFSSKFPRNQILQIIKNALENFNITHLNNIDEYSLIYLREIKIDDNIIHSLYEKEKNDVYKKFIEQQKIRDFYFSKILLNDKDLDDIKGITMKNCVAIFNAIPEQKEFFLKASEAQALSLENLPKLFELYVHSYLYHKKLFEEKDGKLTHLDPYYEKFLELYSSSIAKDIFITKNEAVQDADNIVIQKMLNTTLSIIKNDKGLIYDNRIIFNSKSKQMIAKWMSLNGTYYTEEEFNTAYNMFKDFDFDTLFNEYLNLLFDSRIINLPYDLPEFIKQQLIYATDIKKLQNIIFIDEKEVPTKPISQITNEIFIPNNLGNITQKERLYGYIEFEIEDGVGLSDEKQKEKSQVIFSSSLRNIKHFRDIYNAFLQINSTGIFMEDPNLDFLDDIHTIK